MFRRMTSENRVYDLGPMYATVQYIVNCVFLIFNFIFSIAKGVHHDGRLPFWKPDSVFANYVRIIIVFFAIGEINILLRLTNKQFKTIRGRQMNKNMS